MDVKAQFDELLRNIRLTESQVGDLQTGHSTFRERLNGDGALKDIVVSDFLQGSYRRHTAVKPKGDKRADVDVVIVTNLNEAEYTPHQAMEVFRPFLERHYAGKWRFQGRSIGIELSYVELDMVITSAPSEAARAAVVEPTLREDVTLDELYRRVIIDKRAGATQPSWKSSPLRIPDRQAQCWDDTDPLSQIYRTWEKNKKTGGLYLPVVRAVRWWRRLNPTPEHPKGYPLEHMVYFACPDDVQSVAEGVTRSLETIVTSYKFDVEAGRTPNLPDHGVPSHDVLARVSPTDFKAFYDLVARAARIARKALEAPTVRESCALWQEVFPEGFPNPPRNADDPDDRGGFTAPRAPSIHRTQRFG